MLEGINQDPNTNVTSTTNVQEPVANTPPVVTKPTLDEILKMPEVVNLLETARTQEKNKLYKSIETKEAEIKSLKEGIEQLKAQLSTKENENLSEVQLLQKQIEELQKNHSVLVDSLKAERDAAEREKRKAELRAYKEARLREVGDNLILGLVGGDDEREIDESIELAKQEYAKIQQKILDSIEPAPKPSNTSNIPRVTNPPTPDSPVISSADIKNMSREDWNRQRAKILDMVRKGQIE